MSQFYKLTLVVLVILFWGNKLNGQISSGGTPVFKGANINNAAPSVSIPGRTPVKTITKEQDTPHSRLKIMPYGYVCPLALSVHNSGRWDTLSDGRRVWRLKLVSQGAYSIGILLSRFYIPRGAQLFLYNNYSNRTLGAYTWRNNKSYKKLSIEPLQGDCITLEYIVPSGADFEGEIEVGALLHDNIDLFKFLSKSSLKSSGSCNVNVNCPEGYEWRREKNSVCHISYINDQDGKPYIASGALVNNTRRDATPYLLTAHHVFESASEAESAVFYFNYESLTCEGTTGVTNHTISGSTLKATADDLDFALVELTVAPPESYRPYYAGWDRTGSIAQNTTCIHHPNGDVKKISIDQDSPITGTYSDVDYTFVSNSHWKILRWDLGTTEGGSSGSPLFDENHRIIADLTGGDANCSNPVNDYYAKFSFSWDFYTQPSQQLKNWLDPDGEGVTTLDGYDPFSPLLADFYFKSDAVCVEEKVKIVNLSQGDVEEYFWEFGEGANPESYTGKEPPLVSYSSSGVKDIRLTVRGGEWEDFYIRQIQVDAPPDFSFQLKGLSVNFINPSPGDDAVKWTFGDGSDGAGLEVLHNYERAGNYFVTMSASNACGINSVSKYVNTSYDQQVVLYPNPSRGKVSLDLSRISYDKVSWGVYSSSGATIATGLEKEKGSILNLDFHGRAPGIYFLKMYIDGVSVIRKIVLL